MTVPIAVSEFVRVNEHVLERINICLTLSTNVYSAKVDTLRNVCLGNNKCCEQIHKMYECSQILR